MSSIRPHSGRPGGRSRSGGSVAALSRARTLIEALSLRAEEQPEGIAFRFLPQRGEPREISYAALDRRARVVAAALTERGLRGEPVLLLHPAGLEFVEAFFGCLHAAVIAVPAYPPRANRTLPRLASMAADSGAKAVLVTAALLDRSREAASALDVLAGLPWIATDALDGVPATPAGVDPGALAYLQYTSGSTSEPKGVMIRHGNVVANCEAIREGFRHDAGSRSLSWLPHFHDMGLVDGILQPVWSGFPAVLMDPMTFLQEPRRWLEAVGEHRITHSGGPNFAYDLCARRVAADPETLDLSSWDVAYNGAEPVRAETLRRFAERFGPCGFRWSAFYPAYGLAEATLKVSGGARGEGPTVRGFRRGDLREGVVRGEGDEVELVGCGRVSAATTLRVVDPENGAEVGEGEIGELWVEGPSVAAGYWNRAPETEATFGARLRGEPARYLRTGDLGFVSGGELFVAGRLKDLVIVRGRNLYPQDVEATAESASDAVRPGASAAFGVERGATEGLVVVLEAQRRAPEDPAALFAAVRAALVEAHEVDPAAILLVQPHGVPRTSSGKIRRAACRAHFLEGALPVLAEWHAPPAAEVARAPFADEAADPRTWISSRLAAKLGLAVDAVAFDRPLAAFGLDSLRSMELCHEIEEAYGVALDASELLSASSLGEIAERLVRDAQPAAARAGPSEECPEECDVSEGQAALCFLHELAPDSAAYTIASALRLDGELDEPAFEAAWRAVVARHASLRARIVRRGSLLRQRFDVAFQRIYGRGELPDLTGARLAAFLTDEAHRPFDLGSGPLFRVQLRRGAGRSILLLAAHHAVADLWSLSIVLRDLREAYEAEVRGRRPSRSRAPSPAEFVAWQRETMAGERGAESFAFWSERLSGEAPPLELPVVRPRPSRPTFRGAVRAQRLESRLAESVRDFARQRQVTPYTVLLAAFQSLLSRLSGQTEVAVAAPAAGRTRARFSGLVAYLVNPVVLRADLAADPTFERLVRDASGALHGALDHQDYPFTALVKRLAPPREPGRSPFFDVMFELRGVGEVVRGDLARSGESGLELGGGLRGVTLPLERRTAQFDLSVTATDEGDAVSVEWEYNADLFDEARVGEIARSFLTLLAGALADPSTRVSGLPLMDAEARAAATGPQPPRSSVRPCLSRRFEAQAARRPSAVAARHGDASLTYGDLNRRANALARTLRAAGVGTEQRVAVCLDKSLDHLVALMAVLKSGGAYVPVDPALPAARRRFLVADSGALVVVARAGEAGDSGAPVVAVDAPPGAEPAGDPEWTPPPSSLAYVIYTSGTTGTPKGVAVTHANLAAAVDAWDAAYDLASLTTHLQAAPPGFDVFVGDFARALSSGGTLVLCGRDTLLDPDALEALCRSRRVEFADLLPATARALAARVAASGAPLDSFRIFVVGADAWPMSDYPLFRRALPPAAAVLNSYGVTETTVDNAYDVVLPEHADRAAPAIGRPMRHTAAYVLDARLQLVPPGVRGELCLGGPAVTRGYVGRPDLTAERFVPDPFGPPGSRLYRTGDLARRLSDGRIEFVGRADAQVKIRGHRVEPGEIEAILAGHPEVVEVAVVARRDGAVTRLAAYVVPATGAALDAARLREWAAERVPEYVVPAAFVLVAALPRSANQKVDRRRLPDPVWTARPRGDDEPRTGTERALADVWRDVLGVDRVGVRDNFFELGGDSILVMQVVARAREAGLAVSAAAMFEHPTVAELAGEVEGHSLVAAAQTAETGEVPLLPMQSWFLSREWPDPHHWNLALALDAREPLEPVATGAAVRALLDHHDSLRARFVRDDAGWRQVIGPPGHGDATVAEFAAAAGESHEAAVDRAAAALGDALDVVSGPVFRAGIVRGAAPGGSTLVVVAHHLVVDGVSLRVIMEDLEHVLRRTPGEAISLPARTMPAGAWSRALAAAVREGRFREDLERWRARPEAAVPASASAAAVQPPERTTERVDVEFTASGTERVAGAAAAAGVSVETLLLAAFAAAFSRWSGETVLEVELEGHGRDLLPELDVSRTVGWFTETRRVRIDRHRSGSVAEAIDAVRAALRSVPRGLDAVRALSDAAAVRAELGAASPPATSFNYLGRFESGSEGALLHGLRQPGAPLRSPEAPRTHRLEVDARILGGRLGATLAYSSAQLDRPAVEQLAAHFREALEQVPAAAAEAEPLLPVAPLQEGMLFHHLRESGDDPYVAQIALELRGAVDASLLARAWQIAFDAHEALRAEFVQDAEGVPWQRLRRRVTLPVTVHEKTPASVSEWMAEARRAGFDVARAPLARVDVFPDGLATRVVFTHHHLLLDGWSLPIVLSTVFDVYEDLLEGRPLAPRATCRSREYADWLAAQDAAAAERFFRAELSGFTRAVPLPAASDRAAGTPRHVAVLRAAAPTAVPARARELGLTANTVIQAAWALVLGRGAGREDVVFGVTSSGRTAPVPGLESAVGLFINTLPLRVRLEPARPARGWMRDLQRRAAELRRFEHASLAAVQRCADAVAGELFETLLVFENYPVDVAALRERRGFRVAEVTLHEETNYPLTIVAEGEDEIRFRAVYDAARLDLREVELILERLGAAVEALLSNPDGAVGEIDALPVGERRRIVVEWNDTGRSYPDSASIVSVFDGIAAASGAAPALVHEGGVSTYAELAARSRRIAAGLRARGLPREGRVALAVDRSADFVAAALGTLRAGCAYVPLDPQSPPSRVSRMLAGARVALAVGGGAREWLPPADVAAATLSELEAEGAAAPAASMPEIPSRSLAYVMFTSGSTGEPKGIEITHQGVLNLVLAGDCIRFGAEQTTLHQSTTAFDAAVFEMWSALLHGGRLVIAPAGTPTAAAAASLLERGAVTTAIFATGFFQVMAEEEPEALARVPQLLFGGDVVSPEGVHRVLQRGGARLVNLYGPTEATTFATCAVLDPAERFAGRVPIGKPIPNARAYVVDGSVRPVPIGAPGELLLGGDGLARGYAFRPDLTAERFVPDPFGPPGSRLYRTGDLARWRADGRLEFLGRRDGQLKIRGFRVEVGEVEAALAAVPGVSAAAVIAAGERGRTELVGYVVGGPRDPAELRRMLAERLPSSMVPARLVFLDEMPLTAAGKVDRRALPRPPDGGPGRLGFDPPSSPSEERVAALFRSVLGVARVGANDDFFELGGHSLHAMRVVARVRSESGVDVPLRALFDSPTVRGFARKLESARPADAPRVPRAPDSERRLASHAQARLWFLDRLEPNSAAYNVAAALRWEGPLDAGALESALGEVVRRHEALRTRFEDSEDGPLQIVGEPFRVPLAPESLEGVAPAERETEAARRAAEAARQPFDLERGPLLRARLLRLGPEDHVLALSVHHVAADGWSVGVLARELGAAYAAFARGRAPDLPELTVQYADWAAWQRGRLERGDMERQLAHWRQALAGLPALALPADRPRPARPTYAGASLEVHLDGELVRRLEAAALAERTTLHLALMAGFAAVLGRWSGQDDFGIGTPVANRTAVEAEPLIGFFVNSLVVRARLHGARLSFRDLLGRLGESALGAYANQDVPFERVVDALQPERDLSRTPLFQVMFALQNAPPARLDLEGVRVRAFETPTGTSTFDLTVSLEPAANRALSGEAANGDRGLAGAIEYSTELFDEETIRRLWRHTERMLAAAAADPEVDVRGVRLLDAGERDQALEEWSGRRRIAEPGTLVRERFAARARARPERIAGILRGRRVTYGEIDRRSDGLAARLVELGVGLESRVGLYLERSPELLVAILASWKAGAAYVPIDPDHPRERARRVLEDSGARIVIAAAGTASRIEGEGHTLLLADDPSLLGAAGPAFVPREIRPQALAYVMYTSGTTGRPKGVMISHGALAAAFEAWSRLYGLEELRTHLQMAGVGFDVCTGDVVRALGSGGALVFCERERLLDPAALFALAKEERVDFAEFVPAVLRGLAAERRGSGERLDGVRVAAVGSDAWSSAEIDAFRAVFGEDTRLANSYGVTEATIDSTCWFVPAEGERGAVPPIGAPLTHATAYVLDGQLEPVPPGVIGELYLGGPGVGRGYLGRGDLTAERFVPDPFGEAGARLYRTGDRARYGADGGIVFAGRGDDQVKVRGQRVELAEVEAAVRSLESVAHAVVAARAAEDGLRLAAYVVPRTGARFDADAARQALRDRLPVAWVPSALVILDALPLTANGKVDRTRLPPPRWSPAEDDLPPATAAERAVAAAFAEVLGLPRVGAAGDFFALGGHSLLAVRVVSRLRGSLGVELPLRELFEHPQVRALARRVEELGETAPAPPPVRPAEGAERRRLSPAQWRLWFLDRLEPGSAAYNLATSVRLAGALDVAALERALSELVRRHEALRTRFADGAEGPEQVVDAARPLPLAVVNLSPRPAAERSEALAALSREEARGLFDLTRAPLIRAKLFRLAADDHSLLVTVHHICADGWSLAVLMRELGELYGAFARGEGSPLPELAVQYADWAAWQHAWLESGELDRQLAHWRVELHGLPALSLPADRRRPPEPTGAGDSLPVTIGAPLRRRLETFARAEGATLHMVLLAAYATTLARWSGQRDFAVGTPVANRRAAEVEPLIGFFVNTLALRVRLERERLTFRKLVGQVRAVSLAAHANQDVPFERVVEELQPDRSAGHSPLVQVLFALQNVPVERVEMPGLAVSFDEPGTGTTRFDMELFLADSDAQAAAEGRLDERGAVGGLDGILNYSTELFDRVTMERFLENLVAGLEAAVAEPDVPLERLPSMAAPQLHLLQRRWNARREPWADALLEDAIEAHAARAPHAVALRFGERSMTYAELVAAAERVAEELEERGVDEESCVAICLERSFELVVSLLATLRTGAAYVPVDPAYPRERSALLLERSGARVVLTDSILAGRLGGRDALLLDRLEQRSVRRPSSRARRVARPDSVVYVIYTSGSTGEPKGVALTRRAAENLLAWQRRESGGERAPRTLQYTSCSFDVSFQEIFATLTAGGELVLVGDEQRRDPMRLLELLGDARVERLFLPFVALDQLAETAVSARRFPGSLREVVTAGEQLRVTPAIAALFCELPGCRLVNQYGPAETHVVTSHELTGDPRKWPELPPIGRPLPNAPIWLLDGSGRPVPIGAPGELCVGGAAPARGYHARPDLTAERFAPDPFSGVSGARLYRTGDVARFRFDGTLEFLGRGDDQVKIRGHRVEPAEIEAVLSRHPSVRAAAVQAREHGGALRLCAWVVPSEAPASEASLREHVARALPEFMVPSAFVMLDALPRTATGKVDRRALQGPDWSTRAGTAAPGSVEEEMVAGIFADVLGTGAVGATDDFFALGGHSLLATRVLSRVRRAFGAEVPLRALFDAPTAAGLAAAIRAARGAPVPPPVEHAEAAARRRPSFAQQRLWFLHRLDPDSPAYNLPAAVRLEGALDAAATAAALGEILRRHEALRTRFVEGPDGPEAVVDEPSEPALLPEDVPGGADGEELRRILAEEARRPFVLSRAPMLRARLLRLAPRDHVLSLVFHHVAADGWSLHLFQRELRALYLAALRGETGALPELPLQYADWAAWQRAWLSGGELDRQVAHWREALEGAPPALELPTDRPRPAVATGRGATFPVRVDARWRDQLAALARAEGATLHMALLAAWAWTLMRWSDRGEIVVGTPLANRRTSESEALIGFFVNTLPLRIRAETRDVTFRQLLARVRDASLDAHANQDVPFERIVEEIRPERATNRSPIFQTAFALQDVRLPVVELPDLRMSPLDVENDTAKFDVMLILGNEPEGLAGGFEYSTELFDEGTIERMGETFGEVLSDAAAAPDRALRDLGVPDGDARARILREWSIARGTGAAEGLAHAAFRRRAAQDPYRPALLGSGPPIVYGEMSARANRLAHHLRALGAAPERRVAVVLERSPEALISLFGVLESGAAYVPLDPADPAERVAALVRDSGADVVVTEERFAGALAGVARIVALDRDAAEISARPAEPPESGVGPENLAYLMYTSGSTGGPKPVAVEHRALASYTAAVIERLEVADGWRFALVSTLAADLGNTAIFAALSSGGALLPVAPGDVLDAPRLASLFERHGIDALKIVPSHLAALLVGPHPERVIPRRLLILGGEATSPALLTTLRRLRPECRVANHYGPTETTVGCVAGFPRDDDTRRAAVPLGRPLGDTSAYVLDDAGRCATRGLPGELYLAGAGVARGYAGSADLTAERFLPDPFSDRPGARMYRTGDRARWLPDGRLEFLGRRDHQVKVRGFRVELGEIEASLAAHPDVVSAAVAVRDDAAGGRGLVAWVAPRTARSPVIHGLPRRRLPGNLAVAELQRNETDYLHREIFELGAYLRHGLTLREGDTVFDVGANIGLFSIQASLAARRARIFAFEPNPHLHAALAANLAAYAPEAALLRHGLGARECEAQFTFFPGFSLLSGLHADASAEKEVVRAFLENQAGAGVEGARELLGESNRLLDERFAGRTFPVRLRALSDVIDEAGVERVHFLKVNVEKAELAVLHGIREEHWPRIDQCVVEVDLREHLEPVVVTFEKHGFDVLVEQDPLLQRTELRYVYAVRRGSGRTLVAGAPPSAEVPRLGEPFLRVEDLRAHLGRTLPAAMQPGAWVILESLPVTANGKLDRRRLPDPAPAESRHVAPRGELERAVAAVWAEALGRERVGAHDNFFDLGGHSLLLARVHARLREELGADVDVVELFRFPTVALLAERLQRGRDDPDDGGHRARGAERRAARARRGPP